MWSARYSPQDLAPRDPRGASSRGASRYIPPAVLDIGTRRLCIRRRLLAAPCSTMSALRYPLILHPPDLDAEPETRIGLLLASEDFSPPLLLFCIPLI